MASTNSIEVGNPLKGGRLMRELFRKGVKVGGYVTQKRGEAVPPHPVSQKRVIKKIIWLRNDRQTGAVEAVVLGIDGGKKFLGKRPKSHTRR